MTAWQPGTITHLRGAAKRVKSIAGNVFLCAALSLGLCSTTHRLNQGASACLFLSVRLLLAGAHSFSRFFGCLLSLALNNCTSGARRNKQRGNGSFGKLGCGYDEEQKTYYNLDEPEIYEAFTEAKKYDWKVIDISCGDNHTLAIINKKENESNVATNSLFVWGGANSWQLGLETEGNEEVTFPQQIDPDYWNG